MVMYPYVFVSFLKVRRFTKHIGVASTVWNIPAVLVEIFCDFTQWRSWLRHCAASRKVAGSIPDGITGIFH